MAEKIKVGITHGDINGINYEIILKTLLDSHIYEICVPVVYGSSKVAGYYKKSNPALSGVNFNITTSANNLSYKQPNLINCCDDSVKIDMGLSTPEAGRYAIEALSRASADLKAGLIDVIVTAPINKANVQSETFNFKGHTEYFAEKFESNQLMFMISENLRVGLVSNHESISEAASRVTEEAIFSKLMMINESLIKDFTITNPKIAVLSLNPHAGDDNLIGKEESTIIIPTLERARTEGVDVFGPFAADGFFMGDSYKRYDAVLAMYHDQGMIPFKALAGDEGVNFTAGLSVVRTSPAHGTAYDIAGKDMASPISLRYAIYSAIDIFKSRANYLKITSNPLPYYSKDTWGGDQSASDIKVNEPVD